MKPIDFLLENRESWISSAECADWVQERQDNDDLFRQVGDWSTIYIETPLISYHMEYRQNKVSNDESCAYGSLDTYITNMSPELDAEDFRGILGETKVKKFDYEDGRTIMLHRANALEYESDQAYEVSGPFGLNFEARRPIPNANDEVSPVEDISVETS